MTDENVAASADLIVLTTEFVSAYVSTNPVPASDLPLLIAETHAALVGLGTAVEANLPEEKLVPAVSVRKSVTPDFLICLEDGKQFKSLKRHLASHFDLTPDQYRQKWNLPADYPMVAPNYSAWRSALAKSVGLGRKPAAAEAKIPVKRKKLSLKFD